MASVESLYNNS